MKWKILIIYLIMVGLAGCAPQQRSHGMHIEKGEKVTITLWLFATWEWIWTYEPSCIVNKLNVYISDDLISFNVGRDVGSLSSKIIVDEITANRIRGLVDSLFVEELLPIYDIKRIAEPASAHEEDILDIEYQDKKVSLYLKDVYYKGIQDEEEYHEIVYSRPFCLFVQLLYDICVQNSGIKSKRLYKEMLRDMDESDKYEVLIPH